MKISKDLKTLIAARDDGALIPAVQALDTYELRKSRDEHPEGEFDNAGRWYPSARENCGVTRWARPPSQAWPYSYLIACRSLDHCERLYDADHDVVLAVRRLRKNHPDVVLDELLDEAVAADRAKSALKTGRAVGISRTTRRIRV